MQSSVAILPHWAALLHWQVAAGSAPTIKGLHHEQSAPAATPDWWRRRGCRSPQSSPAGSQPASSLCRGWKFTDHHFWNIQPLQFTTRPRPRLNPRPRRGLKYPIMLRVHNELIHNVNEYFKKKTWAFLSGTYVESMSNGRVRRELTDPVNRHL